MNYIHSRPHTIFKAKNLLTMACSGCYWFQSPSAWGTCNGCWKRGWCCKEWVLPGHVGRWWFTASPQQGSYGVFMWISRQSSLGRRFQEEVRSNNSLLIQIPHANFSESLLVCTLSQNQLHNDFSKNLMFLLHPCSGVRHTGVSPLRPHEPRDPRIPDKPWPARR